MRFMLPLHRTSLAAPLLLALACNGGGGNTSTSDTTSGDGSSSTSGVTPTTSDEQVTTTTVDPTTGPAETTSTTDTPMTTSGTTGPVEGGCELTSDCADGQSCWALYDMVIDGPGPFGCERECVDDMGGGNSEEVWCADDAACCNPDATCGLSGYCELAASTTGDTETTGDTDSSGTDSSGTDSSGTDSSSGSTGDTDTGGGLLPKITLSGFEVTANCQPAVPPDPISAKWTATFDNKLGPADITATVNSASLILPGNDDFVQGITVTPTTSGVVGAGKSVMKAMNKTKALQDYPEDCSACDNKVGLEVVFVVDGQDITATAEATLMCVF